MKEEKASPKPDQLRSLIDNFRGHIVTTSQMYALRGGYGTATNDEETGCGSDNHCDDCKNDG